MLLMLLMFLLKIRLIRLKSIWWIIIDYIVCYVVININEIYLVYERRLCIVCPRLYREPSTVRCLR